MKISCILNVDSSRFGKDKKCETCCKNFKGTCVASIRIASFRGKAQ